MESIFQSSWFWWVMLCFLIIFIWYLRPFFIAPFSRSSATLWGYRLGTSKKNSLTTGSTGRSEELVKNDLKEIIDREIELLESSLSKENERLSKKIEAYEGEIKNFQENHETRQKTLKDSSPSKAYSSIRDNISNKENIKGFAYTLMTAGILLLDTKVASDIFKSFGAFLGKTSFYGFEAENTWIYGFLFTTALAIFLHITLVRSNIEEFFGQGIKGSVTFGAVFGIATIAIILILRISMLAAPDSSQLLSELLLLSIWVVCVMIICFMGKYIGQNENWISAIVYPALFVFLIIFGGVTLIGYLFEFLLSYFIEKKLMFQKSRTEKLRDINETSIEGQRIGFIRGATS